METGAKGSSKTTPSIQGLERLKGKAQAHTGP